MLAQRSDNFGQFSENKKRNILLAPLASVAVWNSGIFRLGPSLRRLFTTPPPFVHGDKNEWINEDKQTVSRIEPANPHLIYFPFYKKKTTVVLCPTPKWCANVRFTTPPLMSKRCNLQLPEISFRTTNFLGRVTETPSRTAASSNCWRTRESF